MIATAKAGQNPAYGRLQRWALRLPRRAPCHDLSSTGVVHVGTSGFVYPHWRGVFYPSELPTRRWLAFYARHFSTVEINSTFYRLPAAEAVVGWREATPPHFGFACKGSRYLTHMKRLRDADQGLARYFERLVGLGRKLRVVLWQLPPQMAKVDVARLDRFLSAVPRGVASAVEFRHEAWYCGEVCDVLARRGAAFCEHDLVERVPPRVTGGFRYLRFHGQRYAGRYGRRRLRRVGEELREWARGGGEAFVYFNNDVGGAAVEDARDLVALVGAEAGEAVETEW